MTAAPQHDSTNATLAETGESDTYAEIAEFYDLVGTSLWVRKAPVLAAALRHARPDYGPIVDIGAGTGLSTETIARAVPGATIIAAEPSTSMRIALATRIAVRELTSRVTIVPEPVHTLTFPDRLGGVVAYGVLGHLSDADRSRLLTTLGQRLAPGAPAVIELLDETAPPTRETLRIAHVRVGECEYEVFSSGADDAWTLTYRVLRRGTVQREVHAPMPWADYGIADLAAEADRSNLTCTRIAPDVAVLTPRRTSTED